MYPIKSFIECIEKLGIPYPEEGLLNFLSEYTQNFTRKTNVSNIYFDGISNIQIRSSPNEMSNEDIENMFKGLIKFHDRNSKVAKEYQKANDVLWGDTTPENISQRRKGKSGPKKIKPVKSKKEILDEEQSLKILAEINESLPPQSPSMALEDVIKILMATKLPLKSLTENNETKYFVGDVWLTFHRLKPDLENALWPFAGVFEKDITEPGKFLEEVVSKISETTSGKFKIIDLKTPSLPIHQRWEIGISGNSQSLALVQDFVKTLPTIFPEIYKIKLLNPEYSNEETCSKAEIYLETTEPNIQRHLDKLHVVLPKELAKMIMPKSCSNKPKFMTNIPAISPGHKDGCIFTFSQGGEEGYKLKMAATTEELKENFDGDSYYKFFGTLDVGIDIEAYTLTNQIIEEGVKIMNDISELHTRQGRGVLDKEFGQEPVDITKGLFTQLLFTFNIPFNDLKKLSTGKSKIKYLWGVDSQQGDVIFVMKPGFQQKYSETATLAEVGGKEKFRVDDKFILGKLATEAAWFTYRNPRPPSSELFCVNKDKPWYTWCNTVLSTGTINFDPFDVDVVLIPDSFKDQAIDLFSSGILKNRLVFYEHTTDGPEIDYTKGMRRKREVQSLSFKSFMHVQREYMKRILYYGLFKNAQHHFH